VPDWAGDIRRRDSVSPFEDMNTRSNGHALGSGGVAHAVGAERIREPGVDASSSRQWHRRSRGSRGAVPAGVDGLRVGHRRARGAVSSPDGGPGDAGLGDRGRGRGRRLGEVREVAGGTSREGRGGASGGVAIRLFEREAGDAVDGFRVERRADGKKST